MPRVALIQMAMEEEKARNVKTATRLIGEAADQGAQIVCLPELFSTLFFPVDLDYQRFDLAEPIPGPTVETMQRLAQRLGVALVVPIYEKVGRSVYYNTAAVIDADGQLLGLYRKNHIPLNTLFFEKLYFKPGNLGYPVFKTRYGNVAVYICHDRHYPEGARCLALGGADIIFIPTATNDGSLSGKVWEKELMAHAIFNELFIAGVNRVGVEAKLTYYGRSVFCNPVGDIVAQAGGGEEVLLADLDWQELDRRRLAWQFYRERRPDTYGILTQLVP